MRSYWYLLQVSRVALSDILTPGILYPNPPLLDSLPAPTTLQLTIQMAYLQSFRCWRLLARPTPAPGRPSLSSSSQIIPEHPSTLDSSVSYFGLLSHLSPFNQEPHKACSLSCWMAGTQTTCSQVIYTQVKTGKRVARPRTSLLFLFFALPWENRKGGLLLEMGGGEDCLQELRRGRRNTCLQVRHEGQEKR